MNFEFYIIGTPHGEYTQYPLDETANIFNKLINNKTADIEIIIHQEHPILYYVYLRCINKVSTNKEYIGFAIGINQMYLPNLTNVNSVFEQLYSKIALRGHLFKYNNQGSLTFSNAHLYDDIDEISSICLDSRNIINNELSSDSITATFYAPDSFITIKDDNLQNIQLYRLLKEYKVIFIKRQKNTSNDLTNIISNLYTENRNLKKEYNKLKSQKKQYKVVITLILFLTILSTGLYMLNSIIGDQQEEITEKIVKIKTLNLNISNLNHKIKLLSKENYELKDSNNVYKDSINNLNIIIDNKDTIINNLETDYNTLKESNAILSKENKNFQHKIYKLEKKEKNLNDEIETLNNSIKNLKPTYYEVYASSGTKAPLYTGNYKKTGDYLNDYTTIKVYNISGGYALTNYGFIRYKDIRKK